LKEHARTPRRLPTLLRPNHDRPPIHKRGQEASLVRNRARLDPVVIRRAEQLPPVERQRLVLVHARRHPAMLLNPVSYQEPESLVRVEVQSQVIAHRRPRPSSGHETTSAPEQPAPHDEPQPHQSRSPNPSPQAPPSTTPPGHPDGADSTTGQRSHPAAHTAPQSAPTTPHP